MTLARTLTALVLVALISAGPATAHRDGKAEPRIAAQAPGKGYNRTLVVRLTDLDSGAPITGARVTVRARMTRPHVMTLLPRTVPERRPRGTYRLPYTFVMPGDWRAEFEVAGPKVITARASLPVPISSPATTAPEFSGPAALPTRLETNITERDWLTMAVLWVHGLAAFGWIVGVLVMAVALSTPLLAEGVRGAVARGYRSWGAWAHWAAVPLIVATGIYNMLYVTPFELALTPDAIDDLSNVAYGRAYQAILVVKLALFVVLLMTGTMVLMRALRPPVPPAGAGGLRMLGTALGAPGLVYLLSVPLILGAAMALRYVHILSHVAEVVNT